MTGDLGINGDLTVDTNALFVDASANKVGINTTTLNNALNVESASYTALGIKRNTGVTTGTGELGIHMETNSQTTVCYDDEGSFVFGTAGTPSTAAGFSEKVRIDASGRVTMPSQPSFYAYTSTDYTAEGALTGGGNWAERWDTGNNFSAGTFTAPVAGKYFFSVMWDANAIRSTLDIQVNTVSMIRYEPTGRTDDTWETHAYSGSLNLAANDAVRLYGRMHSQSSNNPYHMGGGLWGHFSGFLIG